MYRYFPTTPFPLTGARGYVASRRECGTLEVSEYNDGIRDICETIETREGRTRMLKERTFGGKKR